MRSVRQPVKAAVVAAAAVGLVALGTVALVPVARAASADMFVASVPWSSAVIASTSARTLTVLGDVKGMDDRFDCGPVVRSKVTETSTAVIVRVEVFNRPLPMGVGCAGVGLIAVPATVHLDAPLGARSLIDEADEGVHQPLVVDRTPALASVPKPFVRRSTGWEESTGQVSEWWRWQKHGQAQQIDFDFGPTRTARRDPVPPGAKRVMIGRAAGVVSRQPGGDTTTSTVTWSTPAGQSYRLTVIDQARHPMNEATVIALARSVH